MSASGIKSELPPLQYFHPVLREFYASLRETALPDSFSEMHAKAEMKALDSPAAVQPGEPAVSLELGSQQAEATAAGGETAGAVDQRQQIFQFMAEGPAPQQDSAAKGVDVTSGDSNNANIGTNLNVRA